MRKSVNIHNKFFKHYTGYTWSNEHYSMYYDVFSAKFGAGSSGIKHLLSVGGGDHVLFALTHLSHVERLTHVDISTYSVVGALAKFAVILHGGYEDWYAFVYNSLPVPFIRRSMEKCGFTPIVEKLGAGLRNARKKSGHPERFPDNLFHGLISSDNTPLSVNRKSFFLHRSNFDVIRKRLAEVKRYDLIIHDIWSLKVEPPPDMALLSNAYHNDHQTPPKDDFLVRKDGYIIYTECDGGRWFANNASWKLITKSPVGSWEAKLYRRTK